MNMSVKKCIVILVYLSSYINHTIPLNQIKRHHMQHIFSTEHHTWL